MNDIIMWGTGQTTDILEYYLNKETDYNVCGYVMDEDFITSKTHKNKPVIAFDKVEKVFSPNKYKFAILMSPKNLNRVRENTYKKVKEKGYNFVNYISKDSSCETTDIGENVYIFPKTSILPFTKIANNVCIWPATSIGHHSIIEDNTFLTSPKIAGWTIIERNCFLGTNAVVGDHVKIGAYSIIGAGAIVTKNVKEASVLAVKQTPKMPIASFDIQDLVS